MKRRSFLAAVAGMFVAPGAAIQPQSHLYRPSIYPKCPFRRIIRGGCRSGKTIDVWDVIKDAERLHGHKTGMSELLYGGPQ
jgi:hypothetical protein